MDLDARPYRAFITIAETASFSRAAAMLNISQPALSAQLKEFERRLGFALLDRTSRRVALTTEGRLFIDRARRLVMETEWANNAARDIRENQLRIGTAHHTAEIAERNALIDGFVRRERDVPVKVMRRSAEQLRDDLERGDIDIALSLQFVGEEGVKASDALPTWTVAERPLGVRIPLADDPGGDGTLPAAWLRERSVAMIDRSHGVAIAEGIAQALIGAGAIPRAMPEGDAKSVLRQAAALDLCAVDLGWFEPPSIATQPRRIAGWTYRTRLVAFTTAGQRRRGTERFIDALERSTHASVAARRPMMP